jgi:hypothetical protein
MMTSGRGPRGPTPNRGIGRSAPEASVLSLTPARLSTQNDPYPPLASLGGFPSRSDRKRTQTHSGSHTPLAPLSEKRSLECRLAACMATPLRIDGVTDYHPKNRIGLRKLLKYEVRPKGHEKTCSITCPSPKHSHPTRNWTSTSNEPRLEPFRAWPQLARSSRSYRSRARESLPKL